MYFFIAIEITVDSFEVLKNNTKILWTLNPFSPITSCKQIIKYYKQNISTDTAKIQKLSISTTPPKCHSIVVPDSFTCCPILIPVICPPVLNYFL